MTTVYVPIYVYFYCETDPETIGVFYDYDDALKALIEFLVHHRKIYDAFKKRDETDSENSEEDDFLEDEDSVYETDSDIDSVYETDSDIRDENYNEELINRLSNYINTFEELEQYCYNHGDTYYYEHWMIKIDIHILK